MLVGNSIKHRIRDIYFQKSVLMFYKIYFSHSYVDTYHTQTEELVILVPFSKISYSNAAVHVCLL
jgi:hypothetical protein